MLIFRIAWILFFIFVILCSSHHWTGHQALGLSNIINRLVDVFPFKVIIKLSHQTVASFLEAMTYLTCNFQEAALLNMVCDALGIFLCQSRYRKLFRPEFFSNFFRCFRNVWRRFRVLQNIFWSFKKWLEKIWSSCFLYVKNLDEIWKEMNTQF